jgi:hypothetical protein
MVKNKLQITQKDDGRWYGACPYEGCEWSITSEDKLKVVQEYGHHVRWTHQYAGKRVKGKGSIPYPTRTYSSGRVEETEFRNILSEAGIPENMHDAICRAFFEHGEQTPRRLNDILRDHMIPAQRRKIAINLLYGEGTFNESYREDIEDPIDDEIKRYIKRMEAFAKMKHMIDMLNNDGGRGGGGQRKKRRLDDGTIVELTDDEYAQYVISKSSGKGVEAEIELLKKEIRETAIMNEIKRFEEKIMEEIDDVKSKMSVDDFTRLRMYQEKAKEAGLWKGEHRDLDLELQLAVIRKKFESMDKVMERGERFLDRMHVILEPILQERIRKMMLEEGKGPPKIKPINEGELERELAMLNARIDAYNRSKAEEQKRARGVSDVG